MISGDVKSTLKVQGKIKSHNHISGGINFSRGEILPSYEGSYEVTPIVPSDIVLETNGKKMTDDVTVLSIPVVRVSNESGGTTVIIGG